MRCVLLDWYRTLSHSRFWEPWQTGSEEQQQMATALQRAMFGTPHDLLPEWMRGSFASEEVVARFASMAGVPFDLAMEGFIISCAEMRLASDEILPLIDALRSGGSGGRVVGIATDNMDSFTRWTVPALDLDNHVDVILNSAALGALKGDRRPDGTSAFFADFLQGRGLESGETILFDDSEDICEVVSEAGIVFRRIATDYTVVDGLRELGNHRMPNSRALVVRY